MSYFFNHTLQSTLEKIKCSPPSQFVGCAWRNSQRDRLPWAQRCPYVNSSQLYEDVKGVSNFVFASAFNASEKVPIYSACSKPEDATYVQVILNEESWNLLKAQKKIQALGCACKNLRYQMALQGDRFICFTDYGTTIANCEENPFNIPPTISVGADILLSSFATTHQPANYSGNFDDVYEIEIMSGAMLLIITIVATTVGFFRWRQEKRKEEEEKEALYSLLYKEQGPHW